MKTKITFLTVILTIIAVTAFFSCENPISLGTKLDLDGPVVNITSPEPRASVPKSFDMKGNVSDYSGVRNLLIKAVHETEDFARQWRYQEGKWEISDDYGSTWQSFADAEWSGNDKNAYWKITVEMIIGATDPADGQYTFSVQAWDKSGASTDKSLKAIDLIIDINPPIVDITSPYLYRGNNPAAYTVPPLKALHDIADNSNAKQDPSYLGKFITQGFELKWQIDDINEIKSFDLRIYPCDVPSSIIDDSTATPLPDIASDTYCIYYYYKELPSVISSTNDYIKLNGSVKVPALESQKGTEIDGGRIINPVIENATQGKTTVRIVITCYDTAGNGSYAKQEKTIGYFVYWPKANNPWITFIEGMEAVNMSLDDTPIGNNSATDEAVYMVYPGSNIRATAFQAQGVQKVEYALYKCDTTTKPGYLNLNSKTLVTPTGEDPLDKYSGTKINDNKNTIFSWKVDSPVLTGYYILEATAYSLSNIQSEKYQMLFRVQDITFPKFIGTPSPNAGEPLFNVITIPNPSKPDEGEFVIKGQVDDATSISSLYLVWINPESPGYSAMSQLALFRDSQYKGWIYPDNGNDLKPASGITLGESMEQYDSSLVEGSNTSNANRLWNVKVTRRELVNDRWVYDYEQKIKIKDLKIDLTKKIDFDNYDSTPRLKSQIFLLRAANQDNKCTIITYAPQGDTVAPEIKITNVTTTNAPTQNEGNIFKPDAYGVIPKFKTGDKITINGTWKEDSALKLPMATYFKPNFVLTVNNKPILASAITMTPSGLSGDGEWNITLEVGGPYITAADLLDTLAITAKIGDVGGNKTEVGASWLIQSDTLRLMRVSSEIDDGTYTIGKQIEIFLEFNKPVILKNSVVGKGPQLILSSSTGDTVRANYRSGQNSQNSRQYFVYTVGDNETTGGGNLNVKGIANNDVVYTTGTAFTPDDYPFTWTSGAGQEKEEIRLTMQAGNDGKTLSNGYYTRTVPTTTIDTQDDYKYTLGSGKHIIIDTTPPSVTSITSNTSAGYYRTGDIFMTVTFSKPVTTVLSGGLPPRLSFDNIVNGSTTAYTSSNVSDVKVTDNKIVFKYSIKKVGDSNGADGDTTSGNAIVVKNFEGIIQDLAGNYLESNAVTSLSQDKKTLAGVVIETRNPTTPTVKVLTSETNANATVKNTVDSKEIEGVSGGGDKDLKTLYHDNLWLVVSSAQTDAYKMARLEYTTNNGISWITVGNNAIVPLDQTGAYTVQARQVDMAGNISVPSTGIKFTRDPGNLLERISSSSANGTYTNAEGKNKIDITFYFRKPLTFLAPSITVNARSGISGNHGNGSERQVPGVPATNQTESTFTYTVQLYDAIPSNANLDITTINFPTPLDSEKVNVSAYISLPSGTPKLDSNKQFKIETGELTNTAPVFIADNQGGTGYNDPTSSNYHGIRTDDGSYWTTLQIPFSRPISKGDGIITITQSASDYRLPAVLTEAQYNRFKGVTDINKYYTKGTNGCIIDGTNISSDTSTKYVLQYKYTAFGTNAPPAEFINNFRDAEKMQINVNSQAVTINGNNLNIRLSGSNAPQVPGAIYVVSYPKGIVIDSLGNESLDKSEATTSPAKPDNSYTNVSLGGVAKPFVRIKKTQDTITASNTPSMTQPRLVATQPFTAEARIDSRTPGSAISYTTTNSPFSATGNNFSATNGPNGGANDNANINASEPTTPSNTSNYTDNTTITINSGSDTLDNVNGYQWRIKAKARKSSTDSAYTQDIAYRTVITYQIRLGTGNMAGGAGYSLPESGDQIWIRGGDAIGSSSVPGFPFTWDDDWDNLDGKRAGIRLMSIVSTPNSTVYIRRSTTGNTFNTKNGAGSNTNQDYILGEVGSIVKFTYNNQTYYAKITGANTFTIHTNADATSTETLMGINNTNTTYSITVNSFLNSVWRFVTWDINTTAYIDFIRGKDDSTGQNIAWQYGPQYLAYQRAGWTSFKEKYPIYPGKHRWCDTGQDNMSKGDINYSGTFFSRPAKSATAGWSEPNTANAIPQ